MMGKLIATLILLMAGSIYSQQMATVTRANATLHGTPVSTGKVMATLEKGTRIEILIAQGTWHLVQSADYVGWISNGAIAGEDAPVTIPPSSTTVTLKSSTQSLPPSSTTVPSSPARSSDRGYIRGPRGGCYYINSKGKKTYVDRSLCS